MLSATIFCARSIARMKQRRRAFVIELLRQDGAMNGDHRHADFLRVLLNQQLAARGPSARVSKHPAGELGVFSRPSFSPYTPISISTLS